jgi:MFS family permease
MAGTYPLAIIVLLIGGMGIAGFSSMQSTLILSQTPPELRNRVMGVLAVCIGFGPLGVLNVGFLAHHFDPRTSITIIGCLGLICLAFAALRWPELRAERRAN